LRDSHAVGSRATQRQRRARRRRPLKLSKLRWRVNDIEASVVIIAALIAAHWHSIRVSIAS
jgi:hypothetical protein